VNGWVSFKPCGVDGTQREVSSELTQLREVGAGTVVDAQDVVTLFGVDGGNRDGDDVVGIG